MLWRFNYCTLSFLCFSQVEKLTSYLSSTLPLLGSFVASPVLLGNESFLSSVHLEALVQPLYPIRVFYSHLVATPKILLKPCLHEKMYGSKTTLGVRSLGIVCPIYFKYFRDLKRAEMSFLWMKTFSKMKSLDKASLQRVSGLPWSSPSFALHLDHLDEGFSLQHITPNSICVSKG